MWITLTESSALWTYSAAESKSDAAKDMYVQVG